MYLFYNVHVSFFPVFYDPNISVYDPECVEQWAMSKFYGFFFHCQNFHGFLVNLLPKRIAKQYFIDPGSHWYRILMSLFQSLVPYSCHCSDIHLSTFRIIQSIDFFSRLQKP
uniref:Uncharacterized protein n=1 Tax=Cacopsylla melanoneura TaxID=428564 RepID=A0A8D8TNA9_9HEMI